MSSPGTEPQPPRDARHAWARLRRAGSPQPTRSNLLAALLAGALGFALIVQVRQTSVEGLENLREDELVRIFADVDQDGEQLAAEITNLEASLNLLRSQTTSEEAAQGAAQERLDSLEILAGTVEAQGPGIVLTIRDPLGGVKAPTILDAVEELRNAGAEAMQIGDVRIVANTWFTDAADGLSVSGTVIQPPYVLRAIGDSNTLAGAMEIPGGVTATVRRAGGDADVRITDEVTVDALLPLRTPQYAQPVPTESP
jgi:uncharacterized protein YlxW (UPF0749 family)